MKNKILITGLLLSSGFGSAPVVIAENAGSLSVEQHSSTKSQVTPTISHSIQDNSSKPSTKENEDQAQMAIWLIESLKVANDYVNMIDRGDYGQSWTKGDELFQHTISKEEWTKALNQNRKPLGVVNSRKLKDQRPAKDPRGLPQGAYMVVEYNTAFDKVRASNELLTLRRGTDGTWRVLTYQIN